MSKKSETQAYLEQVETLDAQMECKLIEKQQWHDLAVSITQQMGGERVQSSGSKDKMADAVTKCLAMEDEIVATVDKLIAKKKEVTQTIEQVKNPTWYKLLHQRYIQHKQLRTIADNFHSSYDWAKTTHGRALKCVQEILAAKEKDNA